MSREPYEILLLELRQTLKEAEKHLRNQGFVELIKVKRVLKLRKLVNKEITRHRSGNKIRNEFLLKFLEG